MMNARMLIADLIPPLQDGMYPSEDVADAILAAMHEILRADPSILRWMVKPLVWVVTKECTSARPNIHTEYFTYEGAKGWEWVLNDDVVVSNWFPNEEAAQAAANDHHADAVLAAMGVL